MQHDSFMLAALEQAWFGRGSCAPNPSVGAVAVHKGKIIAKAWHRGAGTAHAEQLVLEHIPPGIKDLILYITLEPCNHWGKTPPCVACISDYGVAEVVYAFSDPNPLVAANDTPRILKEKGIGVLHYPLAEVTLFYQSYHYWMHTKKPWVTAKIAQSLDGKIGRRGQRTYLSNADCTEFTHLGRLHSDVILTTAKTIKADDPQLNARVKGSEQPKILAILDSNLSLPREARVFHAARHCHIYHADKTKVLDPYANCSYHALPTKNGLLDLVLVIKHLGELGYHDIWVEAGGQLFSALHREKLVQRTYLYITPRVLGEEALSAYQGAVFFTPQQKLSWQIKADNVIACLDLQEDLCSLD